MENVKIDSILPKMNPYLPKMLLYLPKTGEKVSNLGFYALKFRLVLGSFLKLLKLGSARFASQKGRSAREHYYMLVTLQNRRMINFSIVC